MQIVKSVNLETENPPEKKGSDTMGMKHRVDGDAIYVTYGSINPQLAERTQFSGEDAQVIKTILPKLFENDASSARPDGTMQVLWVVWWQHNCKAGQYSSAKVHDTLRDLLQVQNDGSFDQNVLRTTLSGLTPEIISGF
jgi:CRISPR-associated protein Csd2